MQSVSEDYRTLLAAGAPKETKAIIAGVEYNKDKIVSATSRACMLDGDKPIGGCVAKELNLVLRNPGVVPRMAEIQMYYRLNNGTTQSEWIPKGTYFIDTRDEGNGVLSIDAFDPMLKTEQPFTMAGDQGHWPKIDIEVVETIASRIGVTIDSRTELLMHRGYTIQYPGYGEGAMTCRTMLKYIAQAYAGNWIITDENKLRLIVYSDIPSAGNSLLVTENGYYIVMGGYRIRVSR